MIGLYFTLNSTPYQEKAYQIQRKWSFTSPDNIKLFFLDLRRGIWITTMGHFLIRQANYRSCYGALSRDEVCMFFSSITSNFPLTRLQHCKKTITWTNTMREQVKKDFAFTADRLKLWSKILLRFFGFEIRKICSHQAPHTASTCKLVPSMLSYSLMP